MSCKVEQNGKTNSDFFYAQSAVDIFWEIQLLQETKDRVPRLFITLLIYFWNIFLHLSSP